MGRLALRGLALIILLQLYGCASSSLFNAYPNQAASFRHAAAGKGSINISEQQKTSADGLLYLQESGRVLQIQQHFQQSQHDLAAAIDIYKNLDDRAKISAGHLAAQTASLFSNENAIPYQGAPYERIMVHQYQVFNYLALGDFEAAMVETRRMANLQRQLELEHSQAISEAAKEAKNTPINPSDWNQNDKIHAMRNFANQVASSVLNAYSYFVSASLYEAQGDYNNALVDIRKALTVLPNSPLLKQQLAYLTTLQNNGKNSNQATVFIFYEEGFIANKQSFNLTLPSWHYDTFFSIAVPYYATGNIPLPRPLMIASNGVQKQTESLVYFSALAVKQLQETMPTLIIRQMLRAKSKYELQQKSAQQSELVGLLATIYNIVSEQADLRSWLTLPNSAQATKLLLPSGEHSVTLSQGSISKTVSLSLKPNSFTIIRVTRPGNSPTLVTKTIYL